LATTTVGSMSIFFCKYKHLSFHSQINHSQSKATLLKNIVSFFSIEEAKRFIPFAQFFKYPRIFTYTSMDISLNIHGYFIKYPWICKLLTGWNRIFRHNVYNFS